MSVSIPAVGQYQEGGKRSLPVETGLSFISLNLFVLCLPLP